MGMDYIRCQEEKLEAFVTWCMDAREKDYLDTERKTIEEILRIVKEKRILIDAIRARCWKMVRHALRYPEELHNIIIENMIERK